MWKQSIEVNAESIERFKEDQAFPQSYKAPRPSPSLSFPVSKLSPFLSLHEFRRSRLLTGGGGRGDKSYNREKARPSINHSILSEANVTAVG